MQYFTAQLLRNVGRLQEIQERPGVPFLKNAVSL
jgi:hypothetical protein